MRNLHPPIHLSRLLAENLDVFRFAALGQRLGLLDPVVALDAATEIQIAIDPFALGLLPRRDLREGVDADLVQRISIFGPTPEIIFRSSTSAGFSIPAGRSLSSSERLRRCLDRLHGRLFA